MTLSLVPPSQVKKRPDFRLPQREPWRSWFVNEIRPILTNSIDSSPEFRRRWTKDSPLRFAMVYLDHHLVLQGSDPAKATFNEVHLGLARSAKKWREPVRYREAWIAPRGIGKTSWAFLILPLWALAHGHRRYFMAFSDTTPMAEAQLANLRRELDPAGGNDLLFQDFPELRPRRIRGGANTKAMVVANGGTIAASGLGENTLGRKSGADRPDLMVFDDIEPLEDTMAEGERAKRIATITRAALPMGADYAAAMIMGTTTSYDSVIHQIAQHVRGRAHVDWVANAGITGRIFPAVITDPVTGEERSIWPERWPLTRTHLGRELRLTHDGKIPREFELNFLLDPSPYGTEAGSLWRPELIQRKEGWQMGGVLEHAMYVDVAVTARDTSDRTAIVVVGRDMARQRAVVQAAWAGRVTPEKLRGLIHRFCNEEPTLKTVIVETNQGGDLWKEMLNPRREPLPRGVKLYTDHATVDKVTRAKRALQHYERGTVFHAREFVELEREMMMFPNRKITDDLVDALVGGLAWAFDSTV